MGDSVVTTETQPAGTGGVNNASSTPAAAAVGTTSSDLFVQPDEKTEKLFGEIDSSAERQREVLKVMFDLAQDDPDRAVVLEDLFFYALQFSLDHNYTTTKTWAFLSILYRVHKASLKETTSLGMEESFALFKKLLVSHSVQRPPYSVRVFSLEDAKMLTRYVTHTYYRHYRLYQYVFTKRRLLDLSQKLVVIQVPPDIPPLSQATPVSQPTVAVVPGAADGSGQPIAGGASPSNLPPSTPGGQDPPGTTGGSGTNL